MPIVVSAVFVFIAPSIIHSMLGWHKGEMTRPRRGKGHGNATGPERTAPGDYRFPYSNSTDEMKTPEFAEMMKQGPVGIMSILPSGAINLGKLLGQWFVYSLFIAGLTAYIPDRTRGLGALYLEVFRVGWRQTGTTSRAHHLRGGG